MVVASGWEMMECGDVGQRAQSCSYQDKPKDKVCSMMTVVNNSVLNRRNVLRDQISGAFTHYKNDNDVRKWYVNELHCNHFTMYMNIKSPYCTP